MRTPGRGDREKPPAKASYSARSRRRAAAAQPASPFLLAATEASIGSALVNRVSLIGPAAASAALLASLAMLDRRMQATGGPGIIPFELAGPERSPEILRVWGREGRRAARASLLLDFPFLVAYTTLNVRLRASASEAAGEPRPVGAARHRRPSLRWRLRRDRERRAAGRRHPPRRRAAVGPRPKRGASEVRRADHRLAIHRRLTAPVRQGLASAN